MLNSYSRILFLGLGGAGQRHLRVFRELLPNAYLFSHRKLSKTPALNSDFTVNHNSSLSDLYNIKIFDNEVDAWNQNPDLVVISLPSNMHADASIKGSNLGADLFVEKPAVINSFQYSKVCNAVKGNQVAYFVSFQRRFHPLSLLIKSLIDTNSFGSLFNASVQVNSYLPSWHPYESFRNLYASQRCQGGGVLRTECHELDLLNWFFGPPITSYILSNNCSATKMDVEDVACLLIKYDHIFAQVSLSFMSKKVTRTIEIYGENGWIKADYLTGSYSYATVYSTKEINGRYAITNDDMFFSQASFFLATHNRNDYSYLDSLNSLVSFFN